MTDGSDLDALVSELNAAPAAAPVPVDTAAEAEQLDRLRRWLHEVVAKGASDLLLVASAPPSLRVNGAVVPLDEDPLESEEIARAVIPALAPHARRAYQERGIADSSFRNADLGRFRINLHHERGRAAAAIRRLPPTVPRLGTLNLPPNVDALTRLPRGLVLIGGPTGSGKTTTLAALVNEINQREARHIITIEDPIEYEHHHRKSLIEQVEVGVDAPDFPTALRAALRQAPDVIVVGEMRDPETMQIAVTAGETGHLVFSSLHTPDVATTVARVADSFPLERQNTIRQELAMALAAVLTQTLMPRTGGGLIPAAELLMVGYGARQHVRKNALQHLHQEITITRKNGSFTLEESLTELVKRELIDRKDALTRAVHPEELERLLGK
jgi:twitching motility protein PilT